MPTARRASWCSTATRCWRRPATADSSTPSTPTGTCSSIPPARAPGILLNNGIWLAAPAATGAYALASRLPAAFAKLPSDANFADARKAMPAKSVAAVTGSQHLRQHQASRDHRHRRRASVRRGSRHRPAIREEHRERSVLRQGAGPVLLPDLGPLVRRTWPRRPLEFRLERSAAGLRADPAGRRAWRGARVGAGHLAGAARRAEGADPAAGDLEASGCRS